MRGQGRGQGLGRGIGARMGMGRRRRAGRFWQGQSSAEPTIATAPVSTSVMHVDTEKCVGCGNCADACPFNAVTVRNGKAHVDEVRCRGCRVCVRACPTGAIS